MYGSVFIYQRITFILFHWVHIVCSAGGLCMKFTNWMLAQLFKSQLWFPSTIFYTLICCENLEPFFMNQYIVKALLIVILMTSVIDCLPRGTEAFRRSLNALQSADTYTSVTVFSRLTPLGQLFLASVFLSYGIAGLRLAC